MDLNTTPASTASLAMAGGALAIMAAALCGAPPAHAGEPQPRSERVSYADLNLQTQAGQATLERRLRLAAKRVCREDSFLVIEATQRERECRKRTTRVAFQQMQKVILLAQARTPG